VSHAIDIKEVKVRESVTLVCGSGELALFSVEVAAAGHDHERLLLGAL
jgi:hypothetical protein